MPPYFVKVYMLGVNGLAIWLFGLGGLVNLQRRLDHPLGLMSRGGDHKGDELGSNGT